MKISVFSKNFADVSATERKILKTAAEFYANKLMSPRLIDTLSLTIYIVDGMYKETSNLGDCGPTDDDERFPRVFEINLDRRKRFKRILISLAHEMVHLKQYAKGELKFHDTKDLVTFQKEKYNSNEYWEAPWEIEAYGREPGLFQMFKPTYNKLLRESRKK